MESNWRAVIVDEIASGGEYDKYLKNDDYASILVLIFQDAIYPQVCLV